MLECARTAAAIADGPARAAPTALHVGAAHPDRYPLRRGWEQVSPEERRPLLAGLNERAFAADPRIKKVNLHLRSESSAILIADSTGRLARTASP